MARFDEVLQRQQQTNDRLEVLQQTADAILIQNYELHEYPIPRLFVVLPENINPNQIEDGSTSSPGEEPSGFLEKVWNWDPRSLVEERFKLYFLCECGEYSKADTDVTTSTTKPHLRNHGHGHGHTQGRHAAASLSGQLGNRVHVAKHEGYELSRPTQFFEQYGPYVLGMLQILKYCMTMATIVTPIVGLCQSDMDKLAEGVKAINDSSLQAINVSIDFLEQKLGLDSGSANDFSNKTSGGITEILKNMEVLEGADLRRLETFLRNKDKDKILGNLYRVTTSDGHVKWVCLEHGRISYLEVSMKNFLRTLEVNRGHYDKHLRKVTITLTSSSATKNFMSQLGSKAPGVNELDLTLDWEFDSSDLSKIVSNLEHSNVRILTLDLKDIQRRARIDVKLPGRGKYNPLLDLLANRNIGTLSLKGMEYFGSRTSSLPRTLEATKLRSFHLDMVKATDQLRLAEILSRCPNLVDLKLGLNYSSDQQEDIGLAVGSLKHLEVLHLLGLSDDPEGSVWDHLPVVSATTDRLRELVLVNIHQSPTELSESVQVFKNTLEVLIVDPHQTGLELVSSDGAAPSPAAGVRPSMWSKLTQLQLTSSVSDTTKSLLHSILPHLCLTHLGLAKDLGSLLQIVNFAPLRSIYLYAVEVSDLAPLWKAFPENGGPSQIESLSLQLMSLHDGLTRQLRTLHLKRLWLGQMRTDYQEPEPVQSFDSRRRFPLLDSDSDDDTGDTRTLAISHKAQHNLADLLNGLELSSLEILAIVDSSPATVERVMAKRRDEFSEHLTIHMVDNPPEEPAMSSTKLAGAKSKDPRLSSKRSSQVADRVPATLLDPQRYKTYPHAVAAVLQHLLMRPVSSTSPFRSLSSSPMLFRNTLSSSVAILRPAATHISLQSRAVSVSALRQSQDKLSEFLTTADNVDVETIKPASDATSQDKKTPYLTARYLLELSEREKKQSARRQNRNSSFASEGETENSTSRSTTRRPRRFDNNNSTGKSGDRSNRPAVKFQAPPNIPYDISKELQFPDKVDWEISSVFESRPVYANIAAGRGTVAPLGINNTNNTSNVVGALLPGTAFSAHVSGVRAYGDFDPEVEQRLIQELTPIQASKDKDHRKASDVSAENQKFLFHQLSSNFQEIMNPRNDISRFNNGNAKHVAGIQYVAGSDDVQAAGDQQMEKSWSRLERLGGDYSRASAPLSLLDIKHAGEKGQALLEDVSQLIGQNQSIGLEDKKKFMKAVEKNLSGY
ncbi:hypothetical protein BGZ72_004601 [Mortierella alpina]|nr:hypothetical protein BGZ72_004601 [Mortierella alpina]